MIIGRNPLKNINKISNLNKLCLQNCKVFVFNLLTFKIHKLAFLICLSLSH